MYDNVVNDNAEVKELDVKEVFPNPDQPRKAFDETALKELSESIVKHGVMLHNGKIKVSSEPGLGTEIRVLFPEPVNEHT